jgi:hypothetical protein
LPFSVNCLTRNIKDGTPLPWVHAHVPVPDAGKGTAEPTTSLAGTTLGWRWRPRRWGRGRRQGGGISGRRRWAAGSRDVGEWRADPADGGGR